MSNVATCPGCQKRFRIPASKVGRKLKCPECGAAMRGSSARRRRPKQPAARTSSRNAGRAAVDVAAFAKKALLIVGGATAVGVVLGLVGLASEPVAMAATGLLIVLMVGCVLGGHVWQAIDHGRRSLGMGLAAFFLPVIGPALAIRDKSPAIRGAILIGVALIPAVVGLGMTAVLRRTHDGSARSAARAATAVERLEKIDKTIDLTAPPQTARYRVNGPPSAVADLTANAEAFLSRFDSYVAGSLQYDDAARELTLQYRGSPAVPIGYALSLREVSQAFLMYQRDEEAEEETTP